MIITVVLHFSLANTTERCHCILQKVPINLFLHGLIDLYCQVTGQYKHPHIYGSISSPKQVVNIHSKTNGRFNFKETKYCNKIDQRYAGLGLPIEVLYTLQSYRSLCCKYSSLDVNKIPEMLYKKCSWGRAMSSKGQNIFRAGSIRSIMVNQRPNISSCLTYSTLVLQCDQDLQPPRIPLYCTALYYTVLYCTVL